MTIKSKSGFVVVSPGESASRYWFFPSDVDAVAFQKLMKRSFPESTFTVQRANVAEFEA